jgi:hypothetical protein
MTTQQVLDEQKYIDKILELIETQVKNDDNSLTQSDLQGAVGAIVHKIMSNTN